MNKTHKLHSYPVLHLRLVSYCLLLALGTLKDCARSADGMLTVGDNIPSHSALNMDKILATPMYRQRTILTRIVDRNVTVPVVRAEPKPSPALPL